MRALLADFPVADVPSKSSANKSSTVAASCFLIAPCHLFSSERRVAEVGQFVSEKSKVGREARGPWLGPAAILRMKGRRGSMARTGFSCRTFRRRSTARVGFGVAVSRRGVAEGWAVAAGVGFGVGAETGAGRGVGFALALGVVLGVGVGKKL